MATTKLKIRKGSKVQVIAGADKGKTGTVLAVDSRNMKVKVEGVKMMTHFDKKEGQKTLEGYFDYSNVKLVEAPAAKAAGGKKATSKKKAASATA